MVLNSTLLLVRGVLVNLKFEGLDKYQILN